MNNVDAVLQVSEDIIVSQRTGQIFTVNDDTIEWKINDTTIDILSKRRIEQRLS